MEKLSIILSVIAVSMSCLGIGKTFISRSSVEMDSMEKTALSFLFGVGTLGTLLFLIGNLIFTPLVIGSVILAGVLLWAKDFKSYFDRLKNFRISGWINFLFLLLTVIVLLFLAVASLAEPTGDIGNDTIRYHLLGPMNWIQEGRVKPALDASQTAFPAIVETLLAAVMAISGFDNPCLFTVVITVAVLLQAGALTRHLGGSELALWMCAGLLAVMPAIMTSAGTGYVDIAYTGFAVAAARLAFTAKNRIDWYLAGAFAGFAIGVKYTGLAMLPITAVVVLFALWQSGKLKEKLPGWLMFLAMAVLVGSPWYLKNWIQLGSPIYPPPPLLAQLFPAKAFPLNSSYQLQAFMLKWGYGFGRNPLDFILLPIRLTFYSDKFHAPLTGFGIAPLALAPIGLAAVWRNRLARLWIVWAFLMTIFWFTTNQDHRFLMHVIVVVTAISSIGASLLLAQPGRLAKSLAMSVIGLSIFYGLQAEYRFKVTAVKAAVNPDYAAKRFEQEVPLAKTYKWFQSQSDIDRVLILNPNVQPYYLKKPYVKVIGNMEEKPFDYIKPPADSIEYLCQWNVTHVLDTNLKEPPYWENPYNNGLFELTTEDITKHRLKPVYISDDSRVYKTNCSEITSLTR